VRASVRGENRRTKKSRFFTILLSQTVTRERVDGFACSWALNDEQSTMINPSLHWQHVARVIVGENLETKVPRFPSQITLLKHEKRPRNGRARERVGRFARAHLLRDP